MIHLYDRVFHSSFGEGKVTYIFNEDSENPKISIEFDDGKKMSLLSSSVEVIRKNNDTLAANVEHKKNNNSEEENIDIKSFIPTLKEVIKEIIGDNILSEKVELAKKWADGKIIIQPADQELSPKEIPIEKFFHKIVMIRDRLRVLEQNINSHKKLDDFDKVHLQQYITRIYGSLTTFNILFKNKSDNFVGEKTGIKE